MSVATSWKTEPLSQVVDFIGGGTPSRAEPSFWGGTIPWATVKDFKSTSLTRTGESITEEGLRSSASRIIKRGTLIMPTRMALGKVAVAEIDVAINQDLKALSPRRPINSRFLLHALLARRPQIEARGNGATVKGITIDDLGALSLHYPADEAEQRRIAAILDKADAIRARRRAALANADALARATFLHYFGDPVTNPMGWTTKPLGDVVPTIESGWSPVCEGRPADQDQWGVLKLSAVTSGRFIAVENKALTSEAEPRAAIEVKHGDVLFTRKNTLDLVAATALVRDHPAHLMMSDLIFRLRPDPEQMEGPVLWAQLSHPSLRRKAQKLAGGSAGSMPNISKERLRTLPLIVPHEPVRRRFVEADRRVHEVAERARTALAEADALYASLAARAFRGEL